MSSDRGVYPGILGRHFGKSDWGFTRNLRKKTTMKSIPKYELAARGRQNKADEMADFDAMTAARPLKPPGRK